MIIEKNNDLTATLGTAWETCAAKCYNVAFYTANWISAYSADGGSTFKTVDPYSLAKSFGQKFCCDQVVQYIPQLNSFVWLLQTEAGTYLMCIASPGDIDASGGKTWTVYHLTPGVFSFPSTYSFDYPVISVGDRYFYLSLNVIGLNKALLVRIPLAVLGAGGSIYGNYAITGNWWVQAAQNTGSKGFFATQNSLSQLRIYAWGETSTDAPKPYDIDIASIPSEDWVSKTPAGDDWLGPTTKIGPEVKGVTRRGDELWVAWTGARRVTGQLRNSFGNPHIGIAVIDLTKMKLKEQRYLWNPDHAFAWPKLATNLQNEVGISFMWGGGKYYPQHGVGFLTGVQELWATTDDVTIGGGGHYISIQMPFPEVNSFIATGFVGVKDPTAAAGSTNHAHYIVFRRS